MNKVYKIILTIMLMLFVTIGLSGCETLHNLQFRLGFRNDSFEYLRDGAVQKISIQSTRDLSFKFIVTDSKSIKEMYGLLSNAKESEEKSTLEPDYIVEFQIGKEVKKFNYVVGEKNGNFYNDDSVFTVSNRLDEGIMKNLSVIRKPRDFEYIYYQIILDLLEMKKDEISSDLKVGIDIAGDIDCLKYITSKDLEKFVENANKVVPNVSLIDDTNSGDFDVILTVTNRGYDTTTFKTKIDYNNKKEKIQEDYYIISENEFKEWEIQISEPNDIPRNW